MSHSSTDRDVVDAEVMRRIMDGGPKMLDYVVCHVLMESGFGSALGFPDWQMETDGFHGFIQKEQAPHGRPSAYVIAKLYGTARTVKPSEIVLLYEKVAEHKADCGVFVTTSRFSPDAVAVAESRPTLLIDGPLMLLTMRMEGHGYRDPDDVDWNNHSYWERIMDEQFFDY